MNEGGPLNFDLIACSVENLNHEMKEIRLSQIRRGLFCELDSTNGTAEIIKEKVLLKKVSFITFYVTFTSHHLNSGQVRYSQRSGVSTVHCPVGECSVCEWSLSYMPLTIRTYSSTDLAPLIKNRQKWLI